MMLLGFTLLLAVAWCATVSAFRKYSNSLRPTAPSHIPSHPLAYSNLTVLLLLASDAVRVAMKRTPPPPPPPPNPRQHSFTSLPWDPPVDLPELHKRTWEWVG